ncbi:uncharacterized protein LOC133891637 [Phragmites australis]|uniref:uncharacterized protein LOC133891637 n=1 Tax=Phragmites australis TaxID=29695 RepID=UPI002D797A5B|nr:uncharacterized protein LOC133891637 [Phragmites australis]
MKAQPTRKWAAVVSEITTWPIHNWTGLKLIFRVPVLSSDTQTLKPSTPPSAAGVAAAAMGRGRNRKPRNFATFRLCPRPGAADASDRVFVRVDDNPYSVPGFADDDDGHGAGPSSSSSADDGGGALPDHVRREILELGLPDDGYDYLAHLRELRPSLSSTGGGGASAVFLPSRRPARSSLPVDVKAYDLSRVPIASGEVAGTAVAARWVEEAIDLDVAKLLESDLPAAGSGDEGLEEDFVVIANQPEEDEEDGRGKESAQRLPHEQFDSLALEEYAEGEDDCYVRDVEHELSQEVRDELKHSENFDADDKCRALQYFAHRTLESSAKEQIGESSNVILECAGYAERYSDERREEEQVVLVPESCDGSAVRYCATTVSRSYLDIHPGNILAPVNAKEKLPKFSPGETSMKKAIIKKGLEKLPAEYLPQRRTSSGEPLKQEP